MSANNAGAVLKYNNNSTGCNGNKNYGNSGGTPSRDASTASNVNSVTPVNMNLRSVEEIPQPYRTVFDKYHNFNVIQSKVFNDVFYTDESLAISAPTGSGKTAVFELAIVKLLLSLEVSRFKREYKIIYISPTKALCEERLVDWHRKFSHFDVNCVSATGDSNEVDCSFLMNSNIIITTPEKWDSVTRSWRNHRKLMQTIKLFMIDEIHLLNDESRGSVLEAIVSRMKTIQESTSSFSSNKDLDVPDRIRFIAVSATIPNVGDIAEWLGKSTKPAVHYKFHDDMRPVKLQKVVLGYPYNPSISSFFKFDIMLCYKLHNILLQYAKGKPTLVFCSTRKSVELTAKHISLNLTINLSHEQKQMLADVGNTLSDGKVRELLVHGVGYHHAGLLPENRRAIENVFRDGNLPILVTTSTLAMGVNLPAHLVIIKSTKYYANGEYKDYSESTLYQMIGRAGRPQYDSSATAVIMTTASDKSKYENMVGGSQEVESRLHKHLAEHLNAEVVLRTITDLGVAMQWLTSTFLYIRARKNPKVYGLPQGLTPEQLDKKLLDMCHIEINKLSKAGMLTMDSNVLITPTITGTLMARNYLALETMKLFTQVTGKEQLQQILSLITKCHEYSEIYLRTTDKKALNLLNNCRGRETIRFKLSGKIKTLDMKINCIIQAVLGCLEIMESSLIVEAQKIIRIAERVLNCLAEYLEGKPNCFSGLLNTLILLKCCRARIWENSPFVSRQLQGIGVALSNALVAAEKTTFESIVGANPRDIERIITRKPPTGDKIREQIKHLPKYALTIKETTTNEGVKVIDVTVSLQNPSDLTHSITAEPEGVMNFLIGDDDNDIIVYEKYTHSYMIENLVISKCIDVGFKENRTISAFFISENWVGIDADARVVLFPTNEKADEQNSVKKNAPNKKNKQSGSSMQHVIDTYFKKKKKPKSKVGDDAKSRDKLEKQNAAISSSLGENESEKSCEQVEENVEVSEPNNGKIENDDFTQNATMQHVIDTYFKKKKPKSKVGDDAKSRVKLEKQNSVISSSLGENDLERSCEQIEENVEVSHGNSEPNNDMIENDDFTQNAVMSDIKMDAPEKAEGNFLSLTNEEFSEENKSSEMQSNFNGSIEEVNFFPGKNEAFKKKAFVFSQVNFKQLAKNRETERQSLKALKFEEILHKMDNGQNVRNINSLKSDDNDVGKGIQKFAFFPKKQIHRVTESDINLRSELSRKRKLDDSEPEDDNSVQREKKGEIKSIIKDLKYVENGAKSLTWSSPLVTSPAAKYSPKINKHEKPAQNASWDNSFNLTDVSKSTEQSGDLRNTNNAPVFPLSDKAWSGLITTQNSSVEGEKLMKIQDMASLESFGFADGEEEYSLRTVSQVKCKLNRSMEINPGDYYVEKVRPVKIPSKFSNIKNSKADVSNEKSKVDASVSTDPEISGAQKTPSSKPQKISVVGNTVSNYFGFVPLNEPERNVDVSNVFCARLDEPENKTNYATPKNFDEPEKEQAEKTFNRTYSWEKEFLENEFDLDTSRNVSYEQSSTESINLCGNEERRFDKDGVANVNWRGPNGNDAFDERHSYQRLPRGDEESRFGCTFYSEDNNLRPGPSRHDYIEAIPTELCNDNIRNVQKIDSYNAQQNIEVESNYCYARHEVPSFYRNEPINQSYFRVDRGITPHISQSVYHRQNQYETNVCESRSFAEQMMHPRNIDYRSVMCCQNQNYIKNHPYIPQGEYAFPRQNVGSNTGQRFINYEYDNSAGTNYYSNAGVHPYFPPSFHPVQPPRVPDRSFLMDRLLHSHDVNERSYLTPDREINVRYATGSQPQFMRFNNV